MINKKIPTLYESLRENYWIVIFAIAISLYIAYSKGGGALIFLRALLIYLGAGFIGYYLGYLFLYRILKIKD